MPKHIWLVELEIDTDEGTVPELTEDELTKMVMSAWWFRQTRHAWPYSLEGVKVVGGPREV